MVKNVKSGENMKKSILILLLTSVIAVSGCYGSAVKKTMDATREAIMSGEFDAALNYAKLALDEGCKDENFEKLAAILEKYSEAFDAFEKKDIQTAKQALDSIVDFDGSNMTVSIKSLRENVENLEKYTEVYNSEIDAIAKDFENGYFYISRDDAKDFLSENEKNLNLNQIQRLEDIAFKAQQAIDEKKAEPTPAPTESPIVSDMPLNPDQPDMESPPEENPPVQDPSNSSPKAMLTEQEAINIAMAALGVNKADNPVVSAKLISDYYQISITTFYYMDGETIEDGVGCKVDALTGEVYDQAG